MQNPAWDFPWAIDDYPLNEPVGFGGKLIHTRFDDPDVVLAWYQQWLQARA